MKKASIFGMAILSALLTLASCAPQAFMIKPEMRAASKSGINFNGKSMAVVYITDDDKRDDSFNSSLANGFAARLEEDYFGGAQAIELFKMPYEKGADISCRDTLLSLVMQSGQDVVFLFDKPEFGELQVGDPMKLLGDKLPADSSYSSAVTIPFTTKVYVYDSMDKEDKVYGFTGSRKIITDVFSNGKTSASVLKDRVWKDIGKAAELAGNAAANSFLSTWQEDSFLVIYYDGAERGWNKGAEYAYEFKWKEAIEQWIPLLQCKGKEKKACAAYNIALGCFMSGQPGLALEWLDRSDSYEPVSLSKNLRLKIKQYTGRE
ncbi:MAG: hypothetical protein J6Z47_05695 [Bacteroidales bacterium]|nr:hypothetical protein [Bacteroidales bacterium]